MLRNRQANAEAATDFVENSADGARWGRARATGVVDLGPRNGTLVN